MRDRDRLMRAFQGVDYVVHAAALKQVPAAEYNPLESVRTNVIGAQNVIDAAIERGVRRVVALSSDKAANPVNLYGATKLVSDKLFVAGNTYASRGETSLAVVRYGNDGHHRLMPVAFAIRPIMPGDDAAMAAIIRAVMPEFGAVGDGFAINDPGSRLDEPRLCAAAQRLFRGRDATAIVVGGGGVAPLDGGDADICELRKMYFLPQAARPGRGRGDDAALPGGGARLRLPPLLPGNPARHGCGDAACTSAAASVASLARWAPPATAAAIRSTCWTLTLPWAGALPRHRSRALSGQRER